jgi:hypothetical protein
MRGRVSVSVDVEIDDVLWEMSDIEKQELVDELFNEGFKPKKAKMPDNDSDFDKSLIKIIGKKHFLSIEEEEFIFKIANKIP